MHSSSLRGTDFKITRNGEAIPHADLFSSFQDTVRIALASLSLVGLRALVQ
jgi:hypothetical protein